jgi:hypothetical protein
MKRYLNILLVNLIVVASFRTPPTPDDAGADSFWDFPVEKTAVGGPPSKTTGQGCVFCYK